MTKEDFINLLDKYDSKFTLETGETIQAIYFYDFGKLAEDLVKLLAIPCVSNNEVWVCDYCGKVLISKDYEEHKCVWCGTEIKQTDC